MCCCAGQTTPEVSAVAAAVTGDNDGQNDKNLNDPKNKRKKCEKVQNYKLSKKEKTLLKMASSQKSADPVKRGAVVAVKENG